MSMKNPYRTYIKALMQPIVFPHLAREEVLCKAGHWDQIDRDGKPHWQHCIEVTKAIQGLHLECQKIAILHDIVEDCSKNKFIVSKFNKLHPAYSSVWSGVVLLSKSEVVSRESYIMNICCGTTEGVIIIKIADIQHNLTRLEPSKYKKRIQYKKELGKLRKTLWERNHVVLHNKERQDLLLGSALLLAL